MKCLTCQFKEYMFSNDGISMYQTLRYVALIMIAVFMKILLILQQIDGNFTTSFEVCVWAFMLICLTIVLIKLFGQLKGYHQFAAIFPMIYVISGTTSSALINISISIVFACILIEIKEIFVNVATGEGEKDD